jgi:hypothetical protein
MRHPVLQAFFSLENGHGFPYQIADLSAPVVVRYP